MYTHSRELQDRSQRNRQALEDVLRGKKQGNLKELNSAFESSLSTAIAEIKKDIS